MRTSELHYDLPPERIAQHPAGRRDESRLLVLERASGRCRHERFRRLPELLPAGALLVLNDTRVLPARLVMHRATGGRVEGLFLAEPSPGVWEIMLTGSRRLKAGEVLSIAETTQGLRLRERVDAGTWRAEPVPAGEAHTILEACGRTPLPPYIHREGSHGGAGGVASGSGVEVGRAVHEASRSLDHEDRERYQTVYAESPGAVAAPTAGLHFTPAVFDALQEAGMSVVRLTLHVGVGTFSPIRCDDLADHEMHAEWYACPPETAAAMNAARDAGRPIVAVGTTSVRVLESCADDAGRITAGSGWTRLFIYPPYRFRAVDHLLTNFHLPGSTLLAMIFALAGRDTILAAYREAIRHEYRFYSFGDAMLIL